MSHLFRRHHHDAPTPTSDRHDTSPTKRKGTHGPGLGLGPTLQHISPEKLRRHLPPAGDILHGGLELPRPPASPSAGSTHTVAGMETRQSPIDLTSSPTLHRSYSYGVPSPLQATGSQVPPQEFDFNPVRRHTSRARDSMGQEILGDLYNGSSGSLGEFGGPSMAMSMSRSGDGDTSPKSRSNASSPTSFTSLPLEEKRRHSPRQKTKALADSPEEADRKRRTKDRGKAVSPPAGSGSSPSYPGLVIGALGSEAADEESLGFEPGAMMQFDPSSMGDILDLSQQRQESRHGSASGQAGANIAPWLMDDAAPSDASPSDHSGTATPSAAGSRNQSVQGLSHFASVPSLPKFRRSGAAAAEGEGTQGLGASSRSGSHPSIQPPGRGQRPSSSSSSRGESRSRHGSGDSAQTLSGAPRGKKPSIQGDAWAQPGSRHGSVAQAARLGRLASNASSISGGGSTSSDKKRGLFGVFKRKPTAGMMMQPLPSDFTPMDGHRPSASTGSSGSKMSPSASMSSLSHKRSHPTLSELPDAYPGSERGSINDGLISPFQELGGYDFHLDMNLDDMEGIVDPTLANAPPTVPQRMPTLPPGQPGATESQPTTTALGLSDALQHTGSIASASIAGSSTGGSGGSASGMSSAPGRSLVEEADRGTQFARANPFSHSPSGSLDSKNPRPPSPQNLSPKHTHTLSTQPRRPSQLRNVKMSSLDSEVSSEATDLASIQPIAPAWATVGSAGATVFSDPFGASSGRPRTADGTDGASVHSRSATIDGVLSQDPNNALSAQPIAAAAAWAAPESWGVEADEEAEQSESSSSSEEESWQAGDFVDEAGADRSTTPGARFDTPPGTAGGKPPPFGHKSAMLRGGKPGTSGGGRSRGKVSSGRPTTANRPGTGGGRPGTAGSTHGSSIPHWIRIYRADGSFTVMAFPIMTSTAEIIAVLSGAIEAPPGKKITTSMKLYLRERGQDRMLLPSEKPLLIQDRRLRQAGFTEAEKIEEIGKEDLAILCKFIYQTPVLPVMDPEEESTYESFEFIDISGRDLQTIPIFLHLHASNIVILNVSRNPMTDVPLDFIQACTALKELRMTNMALKRVPNGIRASYSLARLDVSSNRINDLESVPLNEIETLLSLKVQNNKLTSIPTYFAQMKALKYLNISNNKFETFPSVVCEMSNLVDLDLSFNNIAELPSDLSNLKSLEKLAVFGNELTKFPDSFCTLGKLREVDVRRNKLTDLSAVYALPNLSKLQADYNNIVTLDAQLGAKVKAFSVPYNSITRFTLAPLPNMAAVEYSLTHLNLSHGKISTLADEALSGLVNLVELNLNFNQFTRLPPTLDRLTNLEIFSCTDNAVNTLPLGFGRMQKLRVLNVHNNNLKEIPGDIWGCSSLESLNASSNLLEVFPDPPLDLVAMLGPEATALAARKMSVASSSNGQFSTILVPPAGMSILQLFLGDNRFTDDVFHAVAHMPNLKVLNLSFNDIYEIPTGTLSNNDRLEALYLSGNKLTSLPSEDLEKLQRLRVLHLNGNKLQTLPSELGAIKTLQHLDVGSNVLKYNIANWPYDWNWNWNTALRYLNLSGNKRLEIKPTSAQDMSHASSFRKELSDFTALTQLRVLGLMDVTLRIPSLPDESDEKRVRTSFSDINNMAYGISDMLGSIEHLAMFDLVVPNFRGKDNECLFGMFGRPAPSVPSGKVPKFLQESFSNMLSSQLERLSPEEDVTQALRRTFLYSNRKTFEFLTNSAKERKRSVASFQSMDSMFRNWHPGAGSQFRTGAAGAVVYLVDHTLHVANVGDTLVVISRKGEAELLSKLHDPTDREETARIRRAEAWVSPKGYINDDKDVDISRGFGYWQHFPAINASPEVRTRQIAESDEFVIIGNHALWKCCSYQTAVDIARTERDDPMMAAQKLRDFAISYGADGSVMVMVVNISDLFFGRGGQRPRAQGSGPTAPAEQVDGADAYFAGAKRAVRRRYEEVGDRTLNRLQQEIEPPQGQVAIVFTDIVNSTHLWETNPGMPTSIKIHHSLFRRQLRLDGGYEVKTEGDSFMVSFQTVLSAMLWCFNCQILLLQQEWPRELLDAHDGKVIYDSEGNLVQRGLRVRMGIHWGSPQCERDPITRRMDYYGPMVNRAARINASADGGQLMASQDVINEIQAIREYLDTLDEDSVDELPQELKRELQELKRIGLVVKDMGQRKLKGLEVPEKLHLLYPKVLAGRFELSSDLRAEVEVNDARTFTSERQIDIDEVRQLSMLTLRLEALSSAASQPQPQHSMMVTGPSAPPSPTPNGSHGPGGGGPKAGGSSAMVASHSHSSQLGNHADSPGPRDVASPRKRGQALKFSPPAHLGPQIRDDMTDEELAVIIESLTTRIENCLSTLYIKQLGGFSSVLAALEQATRIDQRLIVHAMSLMNGVLGQ